MYNTHVLWFSLNKNATREENIILSSHQPEVSRRKLPDVSKNISAGGFGDMGTLLFTCHIEEMWPLSLRDSGY